MLGAAGAGELHDSSLVLRETTLESSDYSLGPDITTVPFKAPVLSRGDHGSLSRCCGSELGAETGWPDSVSSTPNLGGAQRLLLDPECHQMLKSPHLDQSEEKPRWGPACSGLPGSGLRRQPAWNML